MTNPRLQVAIMATGVMLAIAGLAVLFGLGTQPARAATSAWVASPGSVQLPLPLGIGMTQGVITPEDVCRYTQSMYPAKKGAAVLIKTHICDGATEVCLKSLALLSDKANALIQDNFVVFHSRFQCDGSTCNSSLEEKVRTAWNKRDSNPELIILNHHLNPRLNPDQPGCAQPVFRDYLQNAPIHLDRNTGQPKGIFSTLEYYGPPTEPRPQLAGQDLGWDMMDFEPAYIALRRFLLASSGVRSLLGGFYVTDIEKAEKLEMARVDELRRKFPQPTRRIVKQLADQQLQGR